ncbi:flotillin-2 [Diaphorina citri]|uniref:Flotillin-2 n=1 Tax=Diaphorina citri TaxID=121845 RepID=A0A1S3CZJ4_DIACI|nr:flotillin-2 [Diaphorina citri]
MVTDVQRISLEVMTLKPICEDVETLQGVPVTVTGTAQVKIMKAEELIQSASEQFLGKSKEEIQKTILHTLEGHLRAILGTLTVEEIVKDRDQFASLVREVAAPDVGRMGIEILSFTIGEVREVKEAARTITYNIWEAECEKSAMDIKYATDSKIENNARLFKLQKASFDAEISTAKAESELAFELQAAKLRQKIRAEEILISVVERRKQVEVEAEEIQRREKELTATVKLPAEAECYRLETLAEAKKIQSIELAKAEAWKIKSQGLADATASEALGRAEADRMRLKAQVFKQYGDAAVMALVLDALPKIAAEVAAPLAKTEEIVLLGGNDHVTNDITRLVAQLPPAVQALTGVDISKVLSKIPGAKI